MTSPSSTAIISSISIFLPGTCAFLQNIRVHHPLLCWVGSGNCCTFELSAITLNCICSWAVDGHFSRRCRCLFLLRHSVVSSVSRSCPTLTYYRRLGWKDREGEGAVSVSSEKWLEDSEINVAEGIEVVDCSSLFQRSPESSKTCLLTPNLLVAW